MEKRKITKRHILNSIAVTFLLVALGGLLAGCTFTFFPKQSGGTFDNNSGSESFEYYDRWNWNNNNPYTPGGGHLGGDSGVSWASDFISPIRIKNHGDVNSCGVDINGLNPFSTSNIIPAERVTSVYGWRKIFTEEDGATMDPYKALSDGSGENHYGFNLDSDEGEGLAQVKMIPATSPINGQPTQNAKLVPFHRNYADRKQGVIKYGPDWEVASNWDPITAGTQMPKKTVGAMTPIYAVADGTVVEVGNIESDNQYEQTYVVVKHESSLPGYAATYTRYSGIYGSVKITDPQLIADYFTQPHNPILPLYGPGGFYYNDVWWSFWSGNPLIMDMGFPFDLRRDTAAQNPALWIPSSLFNPTFFGYYAVTGKNTAAYTPNPYLLARNPSSGGILASASGAVINTLSGGGSVKCNVKIKKGDFIGYVGNGLLDPGAGQRELYTEDEDIFEENLKSNPGTSGVSGGDMKEQKEMKVQPGINSFTQRHLYLELHAHAGDYYYYYVATTPTNRGTAINPRSWFSIVDDDGSGFPYQHIPGQNRAYEHAFHIPTSFEEDEFGNIFFTVSKLKQITDISGAVSIVNTVRKQLFRSSGAGISSQSFTLPAQITDILPGSFKNLDFSEVNRLVIPASVTNIGRQSFKHLSTLQNPPEIQFMDPTKILNFGEESFTGIKNLKFVNATGQTIDFLAFDNLAAVGRSAFTGATFHGFADNRLRLPSSLVNIGDLAFSRIGLGGALEMPASVKNIGQGAFSYNNFTALTFEQGSELLTLNDGVFTGCNISGAVVLPDTVQYIGALAFVDNSITSVNFSELENLETIGIQAFDTNNLQNTLDLSNCFSLKRIGSFAFANNWNITEIKLPEGLEELGVDVFTGTEVLRDAFETIDLGLVQRLEVLEQTGNGVHSGIVYLDGWAVDIVTYDKIFNLNLNVDISGVISETIFGTAFDNFVGEFWEINLPALLPVVVEFFNDAKGMADALFREVTNISGIIAETLNFARISNYAFSAVASLFNITLPENIIAIGIGAFKDCINLFSIDILGPVTEIMNMTFQNCVNLVNVYMSEITEIVKIGESAFAACKALIQIDLPNLKEIGNYAFQHCENLVRTVIGDYTRVISEYIEVFGALAFIGTDLLNNAMAQITDGIVMIENWIVGIKDTVDMIINLDIESIKAVATAIANEAFDMVKNTAKQALEFTFDLSFDFNIAFEIFDKLWMNNIMPNFDLNAITNMFKDINFGVYDFNFGVFGGCIDKVIKGIILPDSITNIGQNAFEGWGSNQKIYTQSQEMADKLMNAGMGGIPQIVQGG